jgi:16S rRNA (cytosine1402-N4)-methyltransferase
MKGKMKLHQPVLLDKVCELLNPQRGESYLDLTAGFGGHAEAILQATKSPDRAVLVDRDLVAIEALAPLKKTGARLIHQDYQSAAQQLAQQGKKFDLVLLDLGVSSPQIDEPSRGFSFGKNGPLDMRMDRRQQLTAETLLSQASEDELADIFVRFGEASRVFSRMVAKQIVQARPLRQTTQLAELAEQSAHGKRGRIHPATKIFQAIRIVINDELGQLDGVLRLLPKLLNTGGRVAVISCHSVEDRLVKTYFKQQSKLGLESTLNLVNKKPISGAIYNANNPRARSAKLRAAVRT